MNRYALFAFASLALFLCAASLRAEDPPKTGQFTVTYKDRSPHSSMKSLGERLGYGPQNLTEYDLSTESFTLYVPAAYKPDGSYGLIVFLNQSDDGAPYPGWAPIFDKHKILWVCANKALVREDKLLGRTLGLALDAVSNVSATYKLDPARIYVSGITSSRAASILGPSFPDVFTGGGLYMFGSRFYKPLKGPGDDGVNITADFKPPSDALLKIAKEQRPYVFITGEKSTLAPIDRAVFEGYKAESFKAVDLIEIPGQGNIVPPADWLEKCLVKLDDLRKTLKDLPIAENPVPPVPNPNPTTPTTPTTPTPPVAAKPEVKKGSFAATFDKRSPYSLVPQMSKVLNSVNRTDKEYDITKESFHVYVPAHYEPGKPFGLLVHLSSEVASPDADLAAFWKLAFDKKNFIFVAVSKCPMSDPDQRRIGLALDAVENIKHLYTIDDDRIYMLGLSQASRHIAKASLHFPQVFSGAVFMLGTAYFRDTFDNTKYNDIAIPQPSNAILKEAKTRSRFVFLYGKDSQNRAFLQTIITKGWQQDGFTFAKSVEIDKLGNAIPGIKSLQEALEKIDEPLAKTDRQLISEGSRYEKNRKMGEAWLAYGKAAMRTTDEKRKIEAEGKAAAIQKIYDDHMAGAKKALAAGDQVTAKTSLERIVKEYGSVPDDEAGKLYDSLGAGKTVARNPNVPRNPDEKGPSVAAGAETVAKNRLEAARKVLAANLTAGYKELRDIAERYGETAAGKEALAEADKIWADGTKRKTIESQTAEAEAAKLMVLAKRYLDAGDFLNAKEKLNQIVEDYPESKFATDAAGLLAGIKDK